MIALIVLWVATIQLIWGMTQDKPMWCFVSATFLLIIVIDQFLEKFLELYAKKDFK